jgi:hypothetical protein
MIAPKPKTYPIGVVLPQYSFSLPAPSPVAASR